MTSFGGGGYRAQGRVAAEGKAGGPSMTPGKGPVNRTDYVIAAIALVLVALAFVLLVVV